MSNVLRTKKGYGDFGNLNKNYDKARKGFPDKTIDYIFRRIGKDRPYILDIGCGTGIATEQLLEKGAEVVGTDVDAEMIWQAKEDNQHCIEYYVAQAEKQPFVNNQFDAVTAFSAFHWFANKNVLDEIKRVLKHGSVFFAINKNEIGDFKKQNKKILQQFVEIDLPDAKKEYNPAIVLQANGFQFVDTKTFPISEYFSPMEAVEYVQTMSVWNLVPEERKSETLKKLYKYFREVMKNGKVERQLEVVVVSGVSD